MARIEVRPLVGQRIVKVRKMTRAELAERDWPDQGRFGGPMVIVVEDGTMIYPMADPEGNGPGHLIARDKKGPEYDVQPE